MTHKKRISKNITNQNLHNQLLKMMATLDRIEHKLDHIFDAIEYLMDHTEHKPKNVKVKAELPLEKEYRA